MIFNLWEQQWLFQADLAISFYCHLKAYLLARGFTICKVVSWHLFKSHFQSLTHMELFDHLYVHKNIIYKYEFAHTSAVSRANRKQHYITNKHKNKFYTDALKKSRFQKCYWLSFTIYLRVDINSTCIVHVQKYSNSM